MDWTSDPTVWLSAAALVVAALSWLSSREQSQRAKEAIQLSQQVATAETIMHFTDRFFDLLKAGDPRQKLQTDPDWRYQFWSLQATEFYFFHHGLLPSSMYALWTIDLAELYAGESGSEIRQNHEQYLKTYSQNYDAMCEFYDRVYTFATTSGDEKERNREIAAWVEAWFKQNRRSSLT